ncbi:sugar ABC transporter substrate-binding protein [Mesorhizobium sp.]|uniref:ABC transporter substrate-binding protein n=1 Tax=Mesorhizobium sp. TaxID=1871066 RepID=UPI000FE391DD|nr:sugar ABC transporter substrate-binding protein [Mesorhizobium sp.]RWH72567.1 MAG: sugar ABC transporter substrate-binding protein [Mesorhizobium sp.]RWL34547.1 MAG: sugar ABC transporter substrate-binding protein [Mesorhizobium sp.]RWL35961.1 MAG: sugar ABC transporter substrate-binding protein [Mesorhizobium sp.]RWL41372.1 MAG: sugar ABC transporter substrate-binding protein [Mesorhizobium sp.]RWL57367.1 MAG: sugar ABC transporter substrate-binding protein [Mesorhizobium sp.]
MSLAWISKLTLAAGLVALPVTGWAQSVNISYLTHWSPETVALLEAAAKDFSKQNPDVAVTVRAVPFGDLLTTLRSQGGSSDGPTIGGIYDLWLPELAKDKLVAPAPDAVASEVKSAWPAGVVSAASVGGTLYGIPNEIDVYALNYNKELFKAAGIAAPPKTWAEFKDVAAKLTDKDKGQQGFGMINSWAAGVVHPFASLLVSNGGNLVKDGKPALDSPQAGETFALYEDLIKSGASVPAMATADANTTGPFLDNFVSGKTGMIIMANWWESALKTGMGDKFANVATAPIPVGPSGDKPHSISYSWMTVVNAKAGEAEQKAAWQFLGWLNSPKSGKNGASAMSDILMSMGILPSRSSDIEAHKDKLGSEFLSGYVSVLADARPFPVVLGGQEFSESLQQTLEALQYGQVSAKDAQANAQADATSILERAAK